MADVELSVQVATDEGAAPSFTTLNATNTYYVARRGGRTVLWFENTNASPAIITFDVTQTPGGLSVTDPTITVPATNGKRVAGNFPDIYESTDAAHDGDLKFTCSVATGCTVAAVAV